MFTFPVGFGLFRRTSCCFDTYGDVSARAVSTPYPERISSMIVVFALKSGNKILNTDRENSNCIDRTKGQTFERGVLALRCFRSANRRGGAGACFESTAGGGADR
ncbi:hypothetical protein EVAR_52061_1 [Eumeta japonica]|uniref:Uncharacterized protein n=1 Tax=Eumeta variegata TaxID=151549 RepID=A0A4C1Z6E8_EUMVA|nr:hypothetical protein EVAR_52061_1 [Eumeta japonica]